MAYKHLQRLPMRPPIGRSPISSSNSLQSRDVANGWMLSYIAFSLVLPNVLVMDPNTGEMGALQPDDDFLSRHANYLAAQHPYKMNALHDFVGAYAARHYILVSARLALDRAAFPNRSRAGRTSLRPQDAGLEPRGRRRRSWRFRKERLTDLTNKSFTITADVNHKIPGAEGVRG